MLSDTNNPTVRIITYLRDKFPKIFVIMIINSLIYFTCIPGIIMTKSETIVITYNKTQPQKLLLLLLP